LEDRTLPDIIREVVEGERLSDPDGTLDPAILGSVFEMTINHIGVNSALRRISVRTTRLVT